MGMLSGRDLSVLLVNEFLDDGRIYTMSVSVKDDKVPEVKGRVRATLKARAARKLCAREGHNVLTLGRSVTPAYLCR